MISNRQIHYQGAIFHSYLKLQGSQCCLVCPQINSGWRWRFTYVYLLSPVMMGPCCTSNPQKNTGIRILPSQEKISDMPSNVGDIWLHFLYEQMLVSEENQMFVGCVLYQLHILARWFVGKAYFYLLHTQMFMSSSILCGSYIIA